MNKKTFILIITFLVIIIGFFLYFNFRSISGSFGNGGLGVESNNVKKIELLTKAYHLVLEKKDTLWVITSPYNEDADQEKVKNLIDDFSQSKLVAPVSSNPEKQTLFGVDTSASKVKFNDRTFLIGKLGPDFKTTFVREEGDDQVNIYTGMLESNLTANVDEYRFRKLLTVQKSKVKMIKFVGLNETYTLVNDSSKWSLNGKLINSDKTNPLDETLFSLKGETVIDSIKQNQLQNYPKSVSIDISADKNYKLDFYKIPEKVVYFAVSEGSDRIYSLPSYIVERFFKPASYWLTEENK